MTPATVWSGPMDLGPGVVASVAMEFGNIVITCPEPGSIGFQLDGSEIRLPVSAAREIAAFVLTITGSDEELVTTLTRLTRAFAPKALQ